METIRIPIDGISLDADLSMPDEADGLVIFAHGSGSGRRSPRNAYVAAELQRHGQATLLFDLLTPQEERADAVTRHLRFDIPLLASRLGAVTDWIGQEIHRRQRDLAIGYFGASTGAAAAIQAAAARPALVRAIVSRGGRPDLAGEALTRVQAPTLLIVGGADHRSVLDCNQDAYHCLRARKELAIIPGATHLFEEPGALREVARLAAEWFAQYLHTYAADLARH